MVLFFIVTPCHAQQHTGRSDTNVETRDRKAGNTTTSKATITTTTRTVEEREQTSSTDGRGVHHGLHWADCRGRVFSLVKHKCRETRHKSRKTTTTTTTFIMTLEKRVETSDTNV
ncbi:uncharacterized protein LOC135094401 isoform X2 [Scylla paramamosain]|uniref:uncharacterized protein LOC135094401 isoform X2 n=1 Tax=Scylla paramamosain TaxID=85552 RepID=UPI0030838A29